MTNSSQIPFLLRLIDDASPSVRDKVARELRAFGPQLTAEIERQALTLSTSQKAALERLLFEDDGGWRRAWSVWASDADEQESEAGRLETALDLLTRWQLGHDHPVHLHTLLDELAIEFLESDSERDAAARAIALSRFLFEEKGLNGAGADDYYNPLNSNAVWAIENGRGLPITLACIFLLVGERVGVPLHGCNFPGHFMARAHVDDHDLLFDCFSGGRLLSQAEVNAWRKVAPRELSQAPSATMIIARVLHNLLNSYRQLDDEPRLQFVYGLLGDLLPMRA